MTQIVFTLLSMLIALIFIAYGCLSGVSTLHSFPMLNPQIPTSDQHLPLFNFIGFSHFQPPNPPTRPNLLNLASTNPYLIYKLVPTQLKTQCQTTYKNSRFLFPFHFTHFLGFKSLQHTIFMFNLSVYNNSKAEYTHLDFDLTMHMHNEIDFVSKFRNPSHFSERCLCSVNRSSTWNLFSDVASSTNFHSILTSFLFPLLRSSFFFYLQIPFNSFFFFLSKF